MDVSVEAPAVEPEVQAREAQEDFAGLLGAFVERFESELAGFLAAKADAAKALGSPELGELTDALGTLATHGGKRLRPALVYYSYRACGGPGGPGGSSSGEHSDAAVLPVALAAELLHTYLLIHDDIMDHAEVRRGLPTAHVRFREAHRLRGLAGDGEDFGRSVAILLGDLAHSWAVELLAEAAAGSPHGRQLARCFATMCQEVVGGQYLELLVAERRAASEEELLRVLRLKSGRYSAERPIQLGAILAGAPAPTLAGLARYGAAVGEAFQLQDDLLGLFGDGETVGKPVDSDLKEGKYTFLIHHALQAGSPAERRVLQASLGKPDLSPEEVARALAIVEATGAKAAVTAMISDRLREALAALDEVDGLTGEGRAFLAGLVGHLWERKR
jgi:geranylgeranyl diphosphate synthase type I